MAIKKTIKRRKPTKKGMSTISKVLIGGAVISGGYLIYDNFFNKAKQANKDLEAAAAAAAAAAANNANINTGSQAGNVLNTLVPGLLPAGDQTVLMPDNK